MAVMDLLLTFQFNTRIESFIAKFKTAELSIGPKAKFKSILAPLIFTTGLFSYFTSERAPFQLPGAPFFLGAVSITVGVAIVARTFRRFPPSSPDTESPDPAVTEVAPEPSAG